MGVTGLWTVVHPCARPIKIETLNRKRLAVDASIWIYQFLKAVRDKEGNALRNSHVVGFFRRICKLLFFGIKPVFVFDGGAPALKRQTINARKRRREGRREDASRTAGKLLALQLQRRAEQEEEERKRKRREAVAPVAPVDVDEEPVPENPVYMEEALMSDKERKHNRTFKKQDAYHLPDLDVSLAEMGQPNDPRVMSLEELQHYARQFEKGEDINVYDFSKIDFDSPFFISLPASDRYNILNAARLRSRLRMGYSKEQLDGMFPDRMAFSKFQIERVRERNQLTQRLMHLNGSADDPSFGMARVAGEKNREYVLVKNDGVEGGWALGVVSKDEGKREKPIDVDNLDKPGEPDDSDDEEFEDVPIEGLNRLPKRRQPAAGARAMTAAVSREFERRQALYQSRQEAVGQPTGPENFVADDLESLFVGTEMSRTGDDDEEQELQRAIALSLQQDAGESEDEDDFVEVFQQSQTRVPDAAPIFQGSGKAIAHQLNNRSRMAASKPATSKPFTTDDSDDEVDMQAVMAQSRNAKQKAPFQPQPLPTLPAVASTTVTRTESNPFGGPLPFEKLDLGSSLFTKKKVPAPNPDQAGGFHTEGDKLDEEDEAAPPVPPWFAKSAEKHTSAPVGTARSAHGPAKLAFDNFEFQNVPEARKQPSRDIIDLEAPEKDTRNVVELSSDDESMEYVDIRTVDPKPVAPGSKSPNNTQAVAARDKVQTSSVDVEDQALPWKSSDHDSTPSSFRTQDKSEQRATSEQNQSADSEVADEEFVDVLALSDRSAGRAERDADITMEESPNPAAADTIPPPQEEDIYSDPEDEELFRQLAREDEEHARFASSLQNTGAQNLPDYQDQYSALRIQQQKDRRDADEVTQTMIAECQQLLTLFGLPYITAPMEAEAQCAELVQLGLVDGIVTDDSDTFLFGGTRVYKNFFNQAKFVECFLASDLEAEFGLTRDRLIAIAQFLGSDYTEGVPGVGPVTAIEIMSEFDSLAAFRDWWTAVQTGTLPAEADAANLFRRKFRRNMGKIFLPPSFPNPLVEEAYLKPVVDSDPSPFVWGVPDLDSLRGFLMSSVGWSPERTDEVLVPVIRDMNRRETEGTQSNITAYFGGAVGAGAFAPRLRGEGPSKRLESALARIGRRARGLQGEGEDGVAPAPAANKRGKRGAAVIVSDDDDDDDGPIEPKKKRKSTKGKRRT
ncbi:PIN domain-like protein [Trichodelitschia bisporula]|uniref:PIN domain-like protein n=1 Tax=Trichodelitschia bisporula TaxID=703511 RepID=A0A6G1I3C1_9PEZI|nr:PIN domain-like protein [Trichodelitschia bisporula]